MFILTVPLNVSFWCVLLTVSFFECVLLLCHVNVPFNVPVNVPVNDPMFSFSCPC